MSETRTPRPLPEQLGEVFAGVYFPIASAKVQEIKLKTPTHNLRVGGSVKESMCLF